MISIQIIIAILVIHWFWDFVIQTDKEAKNKSTSWKYLLSHTITYSIGIACSFVLISRYFDMSNYFEVFCKTLSITFITHTVIDYYTSKVNSMLYSKGDTHSFFVSVGFDQLLHYIQLFLTYLYISQ